jgi:hypothetical protein
VNEIENGLISDTAVDVNTEEIMKYVIHKRQHLESFNGDQFCENPV